MHSWRDSLQPVRMEQIAIVAVVGTLRDVLVRVADTGIVEFDGATRTKRDPNAALSLRPLPATDRRDLIAGEALLDERLREAVVHGDVTALAG